MSSGEEAKKRNRSKDDTLVKKIARELRDLWDIAKKNLLLSLGVIVVLGVLLYIRVSFFKEYVDGFIHGPSATKIAEAGMPVIKIKIKIDITSPAEGERTPFRVVNGQGMVDVRGTSEGLGPNRAILLAVVANDQREWPQLSGNPILPAANGEWKGTVLVGNLAPVAKSGDKFQVIAFPCTLTEFEDLKTKAATPAWRWDKEKTALSQAAQTAFTLL